MASTKHKVRLFFGIPIDDQLAAYYKKLIMERSSHDDRDLRWVRQGNYHITLRFLGNVEQSQLHTIRDCVQPYLAMQPALSVKVTKLDHFPGQGSKIIAAHVANNSQLQMLHDSITEPINSLGFEPENRHYNPHITLCRRKPSEHPIVIEPIELVNNEIDVRQVYLYRSESNAQGVTYSPEHIYELV